MHLRQRLLAASAILWACATRVASQQLSVVGIISGLPSCSSAPAIRIITEAQCPLTTVQMLADCVCTSTEIMSRLSIVTQTSCPFQQQLDSSTILKRLCKDYPRESRVELVKASAIATLIVSIPIVLLRLATRYLKAYSLGMDDWTVLAALIALVALAVVEFMSADYGLGLHFWDVALEKQEALLILFYASQIIYVSVQVLVKLSILLLYNRLFPTAWFQTTTKVIGAFIVLHGIAFAFAVAFQCNPIQAAWDRHIDGRCIDISAVVLAGAIFSMIEDFVLMLLPITEIRKLKMQTRVKVTLAFVFALGSFSTVTSLIRLKNIIQYRKSFDPSYDNVELIVWSLLELLTAITTASLPPLKPLLMSITRRTATWGSRLSSRHRDGGNVYSLHGDSTVAPPALAKSAAPDQKPLPSVPNMSIVLHDMRDRGAKAMGPEYDHEGYSSEENIVRSAA